MKHEITSDAFSTEQEEFWAGQFGNDYISRNEATPENISYNLFLFAKIFKKVVPLPETIIEFGSNIGLNLRAIKLLLPQAKLSAVEINSKAVARLQKDGVAQEIFHKSLLEFTPPNLYDFAFIKGVSIHLSPDHLLDVYRKLGACSSRYVLVAEYYNRKPEEVIYRGHQGKLFRRDFGGFFLEVNPQYDLIDYGFSYHKDVYENHDDTTWFLFRKK
jgi:pseudaminic acid biosynthesis-associated methylase